MPAQSASGLVALLFARHSHTAALRAVVRVTQKILALAEHMRSNRKDFSARRCAHSPRCWLAPPRLGFALYWRVAVSVLNP